MNPCCPECNPQLGCPHQELSDVILKHGEKWSYQCQTCECLRGEIDCSELKCPPLPCLRPLQAPGDCCPHCQDPCAPGLNASAPQLPGAPGSGCVFAGGVYESGAQFADPSDPCISCECKVM